MKFFIIRHKTTGEIMPLMKRNRGYSHWNPLNYNEVILARKLGVPRLFKDYNSANKAIVGWFVNMNSKNDYDGNLEIGKDDGRKKDDLEIVPVTLNLCEEKEEYDLHYLSNL